MKKTRMQWRLIVALAMAISGVLAGFGTSSASAAVSAGHTIATAGSLTIGQTASGGGGPVDFWKIKLSGGDRIQFALNAPTSQNYEFQLFAPETTDKNLGPAKAVATDSSDAGHNTNPALRVPYNGTFVLAVCEDMPPQAYSCSYAPPGDEPDQVNPMQSYTFTPTVGSGPPPAVAAKEKRAGATIAKAPALSLGTFEAGGGNQVDFWRVALHAGDAVRFSASTPSAGNYLLQLFPSTTTDAKFPAATALARGATGGNVSQASVTLTAPKTETYVLAVCENMPGNYYSCVYTRKGQGLDPMDAYTFDTALAAGHESVTSLHLSAASVSYGHEKTVRFSVSVKPRFGHATATGKVGISVGKTVCVVRLSGGKGSCSPASSTALKPGRYSVRGFYAGNYLASTSGTGVLTVRK